MATTRVFYKGKKELTMAQFEALTSLDDAVDYDITDFPNGGITNAQMTDALGYSKLFEDGDVFVCLDNGTYTKGHTYQVKVTDGVKSWEDITPSGSPFKNSTFESTENGSLKEDTWKTIDSDTTLLMQHQNDNGHSGFNVSKNYTEMSSTLTTNGAITSTKLAVTNDTATMKSEDGAGNSKQFKMTPSEMLFSERPKVTTNGTTSEDVAIKGDLQNYVPTQSELTNGAKVYSQVTNENGAVSIRVFENGDADLQNISVTKDGVTINGKKPLTSIQPLYKHELVIPYSFSVTDPTNGTVTVNGSVMYHYLSNTGTQITSASAIDDNFLLSGGIGKNSTNTVLLFDVNVTKAGSSITVEAVNASTMGYITGTVGTITDTVTQLI
jgi:hypothetical protein